jgi:hypothetical protein
MPPYNASEMAPRAQDGGEHQREDQRGRECRGHAQAATRAADAQHAALEPDGERSQRHQGARV